MKVVVVDPSPRAALDALRATLPDAEVVVCAHADLPAALAGADAVVCNRLSAADVARADRLRLVQATSAGAERIDRAALPAGAVLCNVRGHEHAIAEWVVMALLAVPRRVVRFDRDLRLGLWHRYGDERLDLGEPELGGRTVVVLGSGPIGRHVAALVGALGARPVLVSRTEREDVRPLTALRTSLATAGALVVAIAHAPETEALVGRPELEALGPTGVLVNVARGAIVQERPLYEALRDGRLGGAALDVWWRYPREAGETLHPADLPFHELDNVLLTPHVSGRSRRTTQLRWAFVAAQLARLHDGLQLENVLTTRDGA